MMLIHAHGNLVAVAVGFFLRDHPTPCTTTVTAGPEAAE